MAYRIFWSGVTLFLIILAWYIYSLEAGLFFVYWWWDVPLHIMGGVYAGLVGAWWGIMLGSNRPFWAALIGALVLGIGVEIAEYIFGFTYSPWMSYPVDTAKDLFDDLIGGAIAGSFIARL